MVRATGPTFRCRISTSSKIGSTMWTSPALGRRVAGGGQPGQHQEPAVGPGEREQPPESAHLAARSPRALPPAVLVRRAGPSAGARRARGAVGWRGALWPDLLAQTRLSVPAATGKYTTDRRPGKRATERRVGASSPQGSCASGRRSRRSPPVPPWPSKPSRSCRLGGRRDQLRRVAGTARPVRAGTACPSRGRRPR